MSRNKRAVSLIELLIAISILGILVIGFSSIDLFSRYHVITSDKRIKIQNDASHIIDHMTKQIGRAIGNEKVYGANSVVNIPAPTSSKSEVRIFIDANRDGRRGSGDYWISYQVRFDGVPQQYQMYYCGQCSNSNCSVCSSPGSWQSLGRSIIQFVPSVNRNTDGTLANNLITIQITNCYDPDGSPQVCGSSENPQVQMRSRIKMPTVSVN